MLGLTSWPSAVIGAAGLAAFLLTEVSGYKPAGLATKLRVAAGVLAALALGALAVGAALVWW